MKLLHKLFQTDKSGATKMISGHFWIVHNGKIVDPYFPYYDVAKKFHGLTDKQVHREETQDVQRHQISLHVLSLMKDPQIVRVHSNGDKSKPGFNEVMASWTPTSGRCNFNVLKYKIDHPESQIKYGDMGWERKDGKPFYEFEHEWKD